jgi:hypothetical protein
MIKNAIFLLMSFSMLILSRCNGSTDSKGKEHKKFKPSSQSSTHIDLTTKESPEEIRFYNLTKNLQAQYEAAKFSEAKSDISGIMDLLPHYEDNWNYGNAVHKINIVAGRIALQEGELEEAKKYLILAGKTKGSPQLNSFGPNMTLAKELLEKGQREVVLQYFDLCSVFWKSEFRDINEWREIVLKGGIPNFGANLKF